MFVYIVKRVKINTLNVSIYPFKSKLQFYQVREFSAAEVTIVLILSCMTSILIKSSLALQDYQEFRCPLRIAMGDSFF